MRLALITQSACQSAVVMKLELCQSMCMCVPACVCIRERQILSVLHLTQVLISNVWWEVDPNSRQTTNVSGIPPCPLCCQELINDGRCHPLCVCVCVCVCVLEVWIFTGFLFRLRFCHGSVLFRGHSLPCLVVIFSSHVFPLVCLSPVLLHSSTRATLLCNFKTLLSSQC